MQDLSARGVGLRVLAGQGAQIDTTTAASRLVFGIFAALAEFERELIRERTVAPAPAATPGPAISRGEPSPSAHGPMLALQQERVHCPMREDPPRTEPCVVSASSSPACG